MSKVKEQNVTIYFPQKMKVNRIHQKDTYLQLVGKRCGHANFKYTAWHMAYRPKNEIVTILVKKKNSLHFQKGSAYVFLVIYWVFFHYYLSPSIFISLFTVSKQKLLDFLILVIFLGKLNSNLILEQNKSLAIDTHSSLKSCPRVLVLPISGWSTPPLPLDLCYCIFVKY